MAGLDLWKVPCNLFLTRSKLNLRGRYLAKGCSIKSSLAKMWPRQDQSGHRALLLVRHHDGVCVLYAHHIGHASEYELAKVVDGTIGAKLREKQARQRAGARACRTAKSTTPRYPTRTTVDTHYLRCRPPRRNHISRPFFLPMVSSCFLLLLFPGGISLLL